MFLDRVSVFRLLAEKALVHTPPPHPEALFSEIIVSPGSRAALVSLAVVVVKATLSAA